MDRTIKCNKTCFFYEEDNSHSFGGGYPPICTLVQAVFNKAVNSCINDTNKKVDCLAYLDKETVFNSAINVALTKAKKLREKENNNGKQKD